MITLKLPFLCSVFSSKFKTYKQFVRHGNRRREEDRDRLSSLPCALLITILSFLPTRMAARTSVLSRRFQHLWQQCPSLHLTYNSSKPQSYIGMVDCALLRRHQPLLHLHLDVDTFDEDSEITSQILDKARELGLRHLSILENDPYYKDEQPNLECFLDGIIIPTLESLSLPTLLDFPYPFKLPLTRLTSLSLGLDEIDPAKFHRLISDLCSLVDLDVTVYHMETISISSETIKKLKLKLQWSYHKRLDIVMLRLPFLELLHFDNFYVGKWPLQFQGDIPSVRKAVLTLAGFRKKHFNGVSGIINYVSHVEELIMHVKESKNEETPFPVLLEPGKEASYFPNLKHMKPTMCFHNYNFEAVVSMLRHSPALQSVKLVHEAHVKISTLFTTVKKMKDWASKLPRNADGNCRYTHLTNLHLGENSKQFGKLLNKKCTPKS